MKNIEETDRTMVTETELERGARRILRPLLEGRGFLAPAKRGRYALKGAKGDGFSAATQLVAALSERAWLKPRSTMPETFALSETGARWIRQALGADQPFAAQHQILTQKAVTDEQGNAHSVIVNDAESPLTWLRYRGLIDDAQFAAGEKLRRDFTLAGMTPSICSNLEMPSGGLPAEFISDAAMDARQRYTLAMKAVGPSLSGILTDVCCHLVGLKAIEAKEEWPRHSARVVLSLGLDHLASHYGLAVTARGTRMRSWRNEGERDAA